jgi:hypothetical protein
MAANNLPATPRSEFLAWVIQHPEQVAAYLERLRALDSLTISVTKDGVTRQYPVVWSAWNGVVAINV